MSNYMKLAFSVLVVGLSVACSPGSTSSSSEDADSTALSVDTKAVNEVFPVYITDTTEYDTDDPAVWVHPSDPAKSLIVGTDKEAGGGLYVYDLQGHIIREKCVLGLQRPNNVDVEYGLHLGGDTIDIAVTTERLTHKLRIFSLPDMTPVDGGGIPVFEGETGTEYRDLMGIGLYKHPATGVISAIVGRKAGPTDGTYLWQYELSDDGKGQVQAELVRKFGAFSGQKEIEAIAVDDALGYVYYSDETLGVRKYYADPAKGNEELALFGTEGFTDDHEGISIYELTDSTGYILVSDQQANAFRIFPREGTEEDPNDHPLLKVVHTQTLESDGSETVAVPLGPDFPKGLFVAMSEGKTFHLYHWEDIAGEELESID